MERWTAAKMPDLTGRIAVVTGANNGLGFQTTLQLAAHRALVVMACRDITRGEEAARKIRARVPDAKIEVSLLDLANLASVRHFAESFSESHDGLDILVNNAGVMAIPWRETVDGFETQFGTNHLGHFALTGLLLPSLLARRTCRVVTVSSEVARIGHIRFDDLQSRRRYNKWGAYAQSKVANLLFTLELDRRARVHHLDLVSAAAHPGYADTNLQYVGAQMSGQQRSTTPIDLANKLFAQPASQGALPSLYAASASDVYGGEYFGPDGLLAQRGYPTRVSPPRQAYDTDVASRLWQVSEQLTGVRFDALDTMPPRSSTL